MTTAAKKYSNWEPLPPKDSMFNGTNPIRRPVEAMKLLFKAASVIEAGYHQPTFGSKLDLSGIPTRWIPLEPASLATKAIKFKGITCCWIAAVLDERYQWTQIRLRRHLYGDSN